jgi:hypothetical protein
MFKIVENSIREIKVKNGIICLMKIEKHENIVNSYDIALEIGISENSVRRTYLHNPKNDKMLKVLCFGSYCTKNDVTPSEIVMAVDIIKKIRGANNG